MGFVFLCYIALGAPIKAVQSWDQTLKNIEHFVKTGYGVLQNSYCYTDQHPIIGPGQGSTGGPSACSTMSFFLLMAMDRLAKGMYVCSPTQKDNYSTKSIMFFDDNTNYNNNFKANLETLQDPQQAVLSLAEDTQHWERLLGSSGGKLKFAKCGFYIMLWDFDEEGVASLKPSHNITDMHLTSESSPTQTKMRQYDCQQSHTTLGVQITPSLQMKDAYKKLYTVGKKFGLRLLNSSLSKYDAWITYFAVGLPSLTYNLPVTHHTEKNCPKSKSFQQKRCC